MVRRAKNNFLSIALQKTLAEFCLLLVKSQPINPSTKEKGNVILEWLITQGGKYSLHPKIQPPQSLGKMVVRFRYHNLDSFCSYHPHHRILRIRFLYFCFQFFHLWRPFKIEFYYNTSQQYHSFDDRFLKITYLFFSLIKEPPQEIW